MIALPTLFVSHGAPTLALDPGATGERLEYIGRALPRPKAILIVSAHWETEQPTVGGAARPRMIYDFSGFPEQLYRLDYPAPGAPALAQRTQALLNGAGFSTVIDPNRGLDHGAWVPLRLLYPSADIPVTQLSIQSSRNADHHFRVGRSLKPLREEGVLIVGSGSFTHNLREIGHSAPGTPSQAYVEEFRGWMAARIQAHDADSLLQYRTLAPHAARAHPTDEHLLPLFVAMGAAHDEKTSLRLDAGTTYGVLAMDGFVFGAIDAPV